MIHLTTEAEKVRDKYLEKVRMYIGMSKTADADEVLRDVNEHIDRELQNSAQPVSKEDLTAVLDRLGSPRQWVSEEDISWWRKMVLSFRAGPEDWRLAYLSFGTLILGTVLTGPIGLFASFCLSRAAVSISEKEELYAKRWLIYPSLVMVYLLIAPILLLWPLIPLIGICVMIEDALLECQSSIILGGSIATSIIALGMAIWWGFLWLLPRRGSNIVKALFKPFAENWKLNWLGYLSIILLSIGLCMLVFIFFVLPKINS